MPKIRIALLVCTNVIGGHEYQAAALGRSLSEHVDVTVFVNKAEHTKIFQAEGLKVNIVEGLLLSTGTLPHQIWSGWTRRTAVRKLVREYDHVIVSAGAVEAGIATGLALYGSQRASMYLPSFYDRVPIWGWIGHFYNYALGIGCKLFDTIITINRIQAQVIRAFSGVRTIVISNKIRQVHLLAEDGPPRLIFVGRLDKQKRVGQLMRWLDTSENPIKHLLIIGDGPLRPLLESQAREHLHLDCKFVGWRTPDEQDQLIRINDILVLNSLIEGEPLVVKEARARGMNILVREIVGTRGVTTKSERFNTQRELYDRLNSMKLRSRDIDAMLLNSKQKEINSKRESDIRNLVKTLS